MTSNSWSPVAERLRALTALAEAAEVDLNAFASGFAALSAAYYAAVLAEGRTSVRMRAVLKALDLKTAKSALVAFAGEE